MNDINTQIRDLIIQTHSEVSQLKDRVDRHSLEYDRKFDRLFESLSGVSEKFNLAHSDIHARISRVELESVRESGRLSAKIALLIGCIGVVSGGVGSFVAPIIKGLLK